MQYLPLSRQWRVRLDFLSPHPQVNRQAVIHSSLLIRRGQQSGCLRIWAWMMQRCCFEVQRFRIMISWIVETLRWGLEHPEVQLIIRCHPAEVRRKSQTREKIADVIRSAFPELPPHITIIPA
jgi:hypothetical protein